MGGTCVWYVPSGHRNQLKEKSWTKKIHSSAKDKTDIKMLAAGSLS